MHVVSVPWPCGGGQDSALRGWWKTLDGKKIEDIFHCKCPWSGCFGKGAKYRAFLIRIPLPAAAVECCRFVVVGGQTENKQKGRQSTTASGCSSQGQQNRDRQRERSIWWREKALFFSSKKENFWEFGIKNQEGRKLWERKRKENDSDC